MFAILLNGFGICLGGLLGYFFKNHSSSKLSRAIIIVMGLQIFAMGIKDAVQYENGMLNVIYLVIGTVIAYDGVKMPLRRTKSATPSCQ